MASGSVRERKTKKGNSYQITIEYGYDPLTGERIRQSVTYHGTKKQAEKEMHRLILEAENGGQIAKPSAVTIGDWLDEWVNVYCAQLSPTTRSGYRTAIRSQIKPYLGAYPMKALRNLHIQTWVNDLTSKRNLSPKTIKNAYLNLKKALDQAVTLKMLSYNPCTGTKLPKLKKYEAEIYEMDEIREMLKCAQQTNLYFPLMLEVATGLRRGELLAVTWDDVDFDKGIIHIVKNRVTTDDGVIIKDPKSDSGIRSIQLSDSMMAIMKIQYAGYLEDRATNPGYFDHNLLVCQDNGKPYTPDAMSRKWRRFLKAADLKPIRFHDLRHSHATALIEAGVDLVTVQKRMGHSDVSILMNTYVHSTKKSRQEAAAIMDNYMFDTAAAQ